MVREVIERGGAGLKTARLHLILCVFTFVNVCYGQLPQCAVDAVVEACQYCDLQFTANFSNVVMNFRGNAIDHNTSLIDVARFHCRTLDDASKCYNNCVQGYDYAYSTEVSRYWNISVELCNDPSCEVTYLFGCYLDNGAQLLSGATYSTSGCDSTRNTTKASISQCVDLYAKRQNCSGVCTTGQRSLKFHKLAQDIACKIPLTSVVCNTEVQACVTQTYGARGLTFISGNELTTASSDSLCSDGRRFSECMVNTVNGTAALGQAPCAMHSYAIEQLIDLSNGIFKPFCDHPAESFNTICHLEVSTSTGSCRKRKR